MSKKKPDDIEIFLREHSARAEILHEVHARVVYPLSSPCIVNRVAFLIGHDSSAQDKARLVFSSWCHENGHQLPTDDQRQHAILDGQSRLIWELHTEFVTLTWTSENTADLGCVRKNDAAAIYKERAMICAVGVQVVSREISKSAQPSPNFEKTSLCSSSIDMGSAQLTTDFNQNKHGFTLFELVNHTLEPQPLGIAVRRILELETYRVLTLLGLPLAREISRELVIIDKSYRALLEAIDIANGDTIDNKNALSTLQGLSLELEVISQRMGFRLGASFAYGRVMYQRFKSLGETKLPQNIMLETFIRRRVDPALETCRAVEARRLDQARKLARAIELINTRIGGEIQEQNTAVLASLDETSQRQYRLQTTVEGLSTIAITYYALGLLSYMLQAVKHLMPYGVKTMVAFAAIPVLLAVMAFVRRLRNKHSKH